jgi:hypothetical protein
MIIGYGLNCQFRHTATHLRAPSTQPEMVGQSPVGQVVNLPIWQVGNQGVRPSSCGGRPGTAPTGRNGIARGNAPGTIANRIRAPTGRNGSCVSRTISPRWGFDQESAVSRGVAPGFHISPRWGWRLNIVTHFHKRSSASPSRQGKVRPALTCNQMVA